MMITETKLWSNIFLSANKKDVSSYLILYYDYYTIGGAAIKHVCYDIAFSQGWNCDMECTLWNFYMLLQE